MADLAFTSATELARLIKAREVSPVEVTQNYLDRIEQLDGQINSYVTVAADQVLEAARVAEQAVLTGDELPPFHGVPISIKDLQETGGIRTTLSTKALAGYVPEEDENAVRRIRDAGFVILGKTNTS